MAAPPEQADSPAVSSPDPSPNAAEADAEPGVQIPDQAIRGAVIEVLKTVYDPEIPVDIYEMGLIYAVEVSGNAHVHITMTLTTPMCPVAETLPPEVEQKVRSLAGVRSVELDLVWDPPWSMDMMSDAARLSLNF